MTATGLGMYYTVYDYFRVYSFYLNKTKLYCKTLHHNNLIHLVFNCLLIESFLLDLIVFHYG